MKKVFFAFVAATVVALSACNNKPAETTEEVATEEVAPAAEEAVEAVAPVDSTATETPAAATETKPE